MSSRPSVFSAGDIKASLPSNEALLELLASSFADLDAKKIVLGPVRYTSPLNVETRGWLFPGDLADIFLQFVSECAHQSHRLLPGLWKPGGCRLLHQVGLPHDRLDVGGQVSAWSVNL